MKLTYNNPAFAKGEEIDLPGFGLIKNGESFEVSDEEAEQYEARWGRSIEDAVKLTEPEKEKDKDDKAKGGKD